MSNYMLLRYHETKADVRTEAIKRFLSWMLYEAKVRGETQASIAVGHSGDDAAFIETCTRKAAAQLAEDTYEHVKFVDVTVNPVGIYANFTWNLGDD